MEDKKRELAERERKWQEETVKPALKRFGLEKSPNRFYSPRDVPDFDFLEKVGFPGEYPFTASAYPVFPYATGERGSGSIPQSPALARAGRYSGYGSPEDTRDYYLHMQSLGQRSGPNLAFDLPTQCGYDSDSPQAEGEVGRVGVAVDTLRDMEVIYEAFTGPLDLDRVGSNFTINAPANIILAMYLAIAEKRGIGFDKLRATPQNDILKEFVARGTYIFPPRPSMRMVRDTITFGTKHAPQINVVSIGGYHIREAGATREQDLAFSMAIGMAYLREGVKAGLDIDSFAPKFTFNAFGGSMELLKEVAFQRAVRRMWANILRERFGARNPKSWLLRQPGGAHMGRNNATQQRPLNNLTRAVVGGIAAALAGAPPNCEPPYDEPLGLGWSLEAVQLAEDAARILQYEAKLTEVIDPLAGSYYVEAMTDEIENSAWEIVNYIESLGGAVAAIEAGYLQREVAKSAYERQRAIESGKLALVGVNKFTGDHELEVLTTRLVANPYDPQKRELAEARQKANLAEVKRSRDNREVARVLRELEAAARREEVNLIPLLIQGVKAYATLGEMCGVLRGIFGEYRPVAL